MTTKEEENRKQEEDERQREEHQHDTEEHDSMQDESSSSLDWNLLINKQDCKSPGRAHASMSQLEDWRMMKTNEDDWWLHPMTTVPKAPKRGQRQRLTKGSLPNLPTL
jgi:hypothetical protein